MTEPESRDPDYLEHMLEAIDRIRRYVGRKRRVGFLGSPLVQDAVIRNIEIIGEAAGRVSPEFAARNPGIQWREIVGMRHRLIHGYLRVNLETVWEAVDRDLPALELGLRALLGQRPGRRVPAPRRIRKPVRRKRGRRLPAKLAARYRGG